jgi:hypothetical protein
VWNTIQGTCVKTLEGHTRYVSSLALAPDGTLYSGSGDDTIKMWNIIQGTCVKTLKGHTGSVRSLALAPDGTLYSGSGDKTIKVWNADGTCRETLEGHADFVCALALGSDGTLYSGSSDKTIKVWKADGTCVRTLTGHTGSVCALVVSPDGKLYSGSVDNTIGVWPRGVERNLQVIPQINSPLTTLEEQHQTAPRNTIKRRRTGHDTSSEDDVGIDTTSLSPATLEKMAEVLWTCAKEVRTSKNRTAELEKLLTVETNRANKAEEAVREAVRQTDEARGEAARLRGEPEALQGMNQDQVRALWNECNQTFRRVAEAMTAREDAVSRCVVCMEASRDTLLTPCNHLITCAACAENPCITECPVCRTVIEGRTRVRT